MSNDTAKIRLRVGQLEVEYEGRSSFLHDDLINLMRNAVGLYTDEVTAISVDTTVSKANRTGSANSLSDLDHSTNTIATTLGVTSGPDLVIAAAAHLTFVKHKDKFTRKDISQEMRSATTFFNESMRKNLSKALNSLVKSKRLNLVAKDTYALSATERGDLETKLA